MKMNERGCDGGVEKMKPQIRLAGIADLEAVLGLNHQLCKMENEEFDPTVNPDYPMGAEGREYFEDVIENGYVVVADLDGGIVGYLAGKIVATDDYRNIGKVAEIENMFVVEKYRGQNIGGQFIEGFKQWAKLEKADRVRVIASAENEGAIEFYEKGGFEPVDVVMEMDLKERD